MKYLRMAGLAGLAMAAISLGSASVATGTELDGPTGTLPVGSTVHLQLASEVLETHVPSGSINCKSSTISGKTANAGGASETVEANVESLSFSECNKSVTVLKKGALEFHTDPTDSGGTSGNGTLTWTGWNLQPCTSGSIASIAPTTLM